MNIITLSVLLFALHHVGTKPAEIPGVFIAILFMMDSLLACFAMAAFSARRRASKPLLGYD